MSDRRFVKTLERIHNHEKQAGGRKGPTTAHPSMSSPTTKPTTCDRTAATTANIANIAAAEAAGTSTTFPRGDHVHACPNFARTLDNVFDNGKEINGANSYANAAILGDGTAKMYFYSRSGSSLGTYFFKNSAYWYICTNIYYDGSWSAPAGGVDGVVWATVPQASFGSYMTFYARKSDNSAYSKEFRVYMKSDAIWLLSLGNLCLMGDNDSDDYWYVTTAANVCSFLPNEDAVHKIGSSTKAAAEIYTVKQFADHIGERTAAHGIVLDNNLDGGAKKVSNIENLVLPTAAPAVPVSGSIYYDEANGKIMIYNATAEGYDEWTKDA